MRIGIYIYKKHYAICYHLIRLLLEKLSLKLDLIDDRLRSHLLQEKKRLSNRKAVTSANRDGFTEQNTTH